MTHILAIDQGTTSSRAIVFDGAMVPVAQAQEEFPQHFPAPGWVEHDPRDLWDTVLRTARAALTQAGIAAQDLSGIGITNQRETTLLWDRQTGAPLHNAIVWQDRRTADRCAALRANGAQEQIRATTGLVLDPYFSATKLAWVLDEIPDARRRAQAGELAFGTVDSYLIWRLTDGQSHVTDATNAARTMLYDIHAGEWSREICDLLDIPMALLPTVHDCAAEFGVTSAAHLGAPVPILGVAGDQQAATIGQACFTPGMIKATYGTGCFALLNTGGAVQSDHGLLTTIAYQLNGEVAYALEGSIFVAGAAVQWLRDGLGMIDAAPEVQAMAQASDPEQPIIMVPAFTGLGAPYWRPDVRGAMFGLTRNTGPAEFARAALESVGYQTRDLIEAMHKDMGDGADTVLRVDGGLSASDWAMQFLADILGAPVDRPKGLETTALGVAWLAGMQAGIYPDQAGFAAAWVQQAQFTPAMPPKQRAAKYDAWQRAVDAVMAASQT